MLLCQCTVDRCVCLSNTTASHNKLDILPQDRSLRKVFICDYAYQFCIWRDFVYEMHFLCEGSFEYEMYFV